MKTWSNWHHSPMHIFSQSGTYMVTGATYLKQHFFRSHAGLDLVTGQLLDQAERFDWKIHAFAVFSNHYHFVGTSLTPENLPTFMKAMHSTTAIEINKQQNAEGRKVWHDYFDTRLDDTKAYFTRFRYVLENPVRHRLVRVAEDYPWCSAASFKEKATPAQQGRLATFKIDRVKVVDDFDPELDAP